MGITVGLHGSSVSDGSNVRPEVRPALAQLDVQAVMGRCSNVGVSTNERDPALGPANSAGGLGFASSHRRAAGNDNCGTAGAPWLLGCVQVTCRDGIEAGKPCGQRQKSIPRSEPY
ncbi:hypothetical protein [Parapedobacter sp.]